VYLKQIRKKHQRSFSFVSSK